MFITEICPSGGTKYVSLELLLSILREPGEGRGGAAGTVPLQNPEGISRKPNFSQSQPILRFWPISSRFWPILAKETPEFLDKIKAGQFTLNDTTSRAYVHV